MTAEKPTILAIVGESGSGKTTLARYLYEKYNIWNIVSYTTRPARPGEANHVDHIFVSDPGRDVRESRETLAWTFFGGHQYWTTPDQVRNGINTYVIDEKGLYDLEEHWSDWYNIVPVKLERPDNPTEQRRKDRDAERVAYENYRIILKNEGTREEFLNRAGHVIANFFSRSIIAVDFDGTCVTHRYPEMGTDIGAVPVLRALADRGHRLILNTMRDWEVNRHLEEAVNWFKKHGIPVTTGKHPDQGTWTASNKTYANLYIDDAGAGTPVKYDENGRKYVDWTKMCQLLKDEGYIDQTVLF